MGIQLESVSFQNKNYSDLILIMHFLSVILVVE